MKLDEHTTPDSESVDSEPPAGESLAPGAGDRPATPHRGVSREDMAEIAWQSRLDAKIDEIRAELRTLREASPSKLEKRVVMGVIIMLAAQQLHISPESIKTLFAGSAGAIVEVWRH